MSAIVSSRVTVWPTKTCKRFWQHAERLRCRDRRFPYDGKSIRSIQSAYQGAVDCCARRGVILSDDTPTNIRHNKTVAEHGNMTKLEILAQPTHERGVDNRPIQIVVANRPRS